MKILKVTMNYTMWLLALLFLTCSGARAQDKVVWNPVGSFGGGGNDGSGAGKNDARGNIYMTGYFSDTATFGNKVLVSYGASDAYLAKFGRQGKLEWIVQMGGTAADEGTDVAFDSKGNVYVVGWFINSATFQSANGEITTVTGYINENIFLAKYSPAGLLLWLRTGGNPVTYDGNQRAWGVTLNPKTGSIYLTGFAEGTTLFSTTTGPNQPVAGPDPWHWYLVKYDTQGNFHWGVTDSGEPNSIGYKVALDQQENVYSVGWFDGYTTFGSMDGKSQTITPFGGEDGFLAKYDSNGNLKWVNHLGSNLAYSTNLAVSDLGIISMTGEVEDETIVSSLPPGTDIDLGGGYGNWDVFTASYDPSGVLKNANRIGGPNLDFGSGIAYDPHGNMYLTGYFSGLVDFGGITLNGSEPNNVFVAKYGPGGAVVWAVAAPGAGDPNAWQEWGARVWLEGWMSPNGQFQTSKQVIVSGPYVGTATFGDYQYSSTGGDNVYLMKLNQE